MFLSLLFGVCALAIALMPAVTSSAPEEKKAVSAVPVPTPPATNNAVAVDNWPGWLGPNHDGKSLAKGLLKEWPEGGPKQLWKVSGIGRGFSSVAVADGKVYVTGTEKDKGTLTAIDGDGKVLWTANCGRQRGQDYPNSPAVDGGHVYTMDANGLLICHDAQTGQKKWSREMREFGGGSHEHGYTESPLVVDDKVIFSPGGKNCMVAFDKTTGKDVWKSTGFADGVMYSSCISFVFGGVPMVVNGTGGGLRCVNAKTGELLWKNGEAVAPWSVPTPCFGEGYVIWANGYGRGGVCMKLNEDGGAKQAWTSRDMDCLTGNYVIDNGFIYSTHGDACACVDLKTGKKKWTERGTGGGYLCWADGMLYTLSKGGEAGLCTCSPDGSKVKGRMRIAGDGAAQSMPVVTAGRLYLRHGSNLYCFDVKAQ